jgi:CBS domain-containing protein
MAPHGVWACAETDDCRHVAQMMVEHDVGSIPVLDEEGRLEGLITDRDICCKIVAQGKSYETPARELMSSPVYTCRPETSLKDVEETMEQHRIRRLPVVDAQNHLQGFISLGDLAHHCTGASKIWQEHRLANVLEAVSSPLP